MILFLDTVDGEGLSVLRLLTLSDIALLSLCPGNTFAESSLVMTMATVLATLNVRKFRNEQGVEVDPVMEEVTGLIRWVHCLKNFPLEGAAELSPLGRSAAGRGRSYALLSPAIQV